ncbi:MAG TPA: hypothetical protein VFO78_05685 [Candidatus Limnocylindrales bacterium]|nr:hypothetical protein [Candidatus Limnocylindrales bacterium]
MNASHARIGRLLATLFLGLAVAACSAWASEPATTGAPGSSAGSSASSSAGSAPGSGPVDGALQGGPTATPGTRVTPGPRVTPRAVPSATPSPAATPLPTPVPTATPAPEPFAFNLYHRGDFVAQYTFEWCVGASLQMALRIVDRTDDTSRAYQQELWEMARDRSFSPFGGANPRGWTAALNDLGIGPYRLVSLPTLDEAIRVAAEALRTTERPVGLVMWRGRHAWVMSGFESVGDPAIHNTFRVTGVRVLDPLHPHGSSVWGSSPAPNSLLSLETLGKQFVLRDSRRVNLGVPPGYLLVLPVVEAAA